MSVSQHQPSAKQLQDLSAPTPRPVSTYRLQFHKGFTFNDAAELIPYLATLGISHVYASPYLQAAPGSTHGYDVVNPEALNSECGTEEDYRAFLAALREHGMSHILDIVPNHMGVGTDQNPWWNDVLEFGLSSPFANFFDIAWENPGPADRREKVVLPILGDAPGMVVEKGELKLVFDDNGFGLQYFKRRLPVTPESYAAIFANHPAFSSQMDRIRQLPEPGVEHHRQAVAIKRDVITAVATEEGKKAIEQILQGFNAEDHHEQTLELLGQQHYRLVFWREATETMNYRRFFDINDLAALRMERDEVFERTHAIILQRLALGDISGVRVDHPDGLANPRRYFERLQTAYARERAKMLEPALGRKINTDSAIDEKRLYIVAEKILGFDEKLDESWPIDGTTGYDFLAKLNAFFVNPRGREPLSQLYHEFTGCSNDFAALGFECKRFMLRKSFSCELASLVHRVERVARHILGDRCPSHEQIDEAVAELIVHFPVYRSYLTEEQASPDDVRVIRQAVQTLLDNKPDASQAAVDFFRALLLNEGEFASHPEFRQHRWPIVRRFQQLTSPVTAKGVEDTAIYRFHRLISLNDVGCEPDHFGLSTAELHAIFQDRQLHWPNALSTLSTHDTKRSEDVRARLHVLADIPDRWREAAFRWAKINEPIFSSLGIQRLDANTEFLVYQTLLGAWLPGMRDADETFVSRILAYLQKATREAKLHTNWTDPNTEYESRFEKFVRAIFDRNTSAAFLEDLVGFAQSLTRIGYVNSLSQTLVKLTAPGVPDTYQGTELWDFSLVDPDNRRPVNYEQRSDWLARGTANLSELLASPDDGRIKLHLTRTALLARNDFSKCFQDGRYTPIEVRGERSEYLFAFAREDGETSIITLVPRFPGEWMPFQPDAPLRAPSALLDALTLQVSPSTRYRELLTGQRFESNSHGALPATALLSQFPVALLLREDGATVENPA